MPQVELSVEDFSAAIHVAEHRLIESLRNNRQDTLYDKTWDEAFKIHLYGACGELALAKYLNEYPRMSVGQFSGMESDHTLPNGTMIEVRHRSRPTYELKVNPKDDPQRIYLLTRGLPPTIDVVGWVWGHEAQKDEWLKDHGGYGRPCWFVPDEALRGLEELARL